MADSSSGVSAESPSQFGRPAWRDVLKRTGKEVSEDHVSMISAGAAFYLFLALFPGIAAAVSIYGMVANPADVQQAVQQLRGFMPGQVIDIMGQQMTKVASTSGSALSVGAIVGVLLALWSANSGTKALIEALNITYKQHEHRGFLRLNGTSLLLTLGVIVLLIAAVASVVVLPAFIDKLPLPQIAKTVASWGRWPLLAVGLLIALAIFYRYAPSRREPRWQWVSWGAVVATVLWLIASGIFSFYVSHSGSYNATYGSLAAIVILLMWFNISSFVVLFGAELNSEMEHQTARDTTVGGEKPLGAREATMADTVAASGTEEGAEAQKRPRAEGEKRRRAPSPAPRREYREGPVGEIQQELDTTRRRMDETLRALGERLSPSQMAERATESVQEEIRELGSGEFKVKDRPLLLGSIGVAAGALIAVALSNRGYDGSRRVQ